MAIGRYQTKDFDVNAPGYSADVDGNGNKGWLLWESELGFHPGSLFNRHQVVVDGGTVTYNVDVCPVGSETFRSVLTGQTAASVSIVPELAIRALRIVITANGATPVLKLASWTSGL
jgi:hypothetical protein